MPCPSRALAAAFAFIAAATCGAAGSWADGLFGRLTDPQPAEAPAEPDVAAAFDLTGLWSGYYNCNQGRTALDLALEDLGDNRVWGTFSFHAPPSNANVPTGAFIMAGHYRPGTGELTLVPGDWLIRPEGYSPVGMTGRFTVPQGATEPSRIAGAIDFDGCGSFEVRRIAGTAVSLGPVPAPAQALLAAQP